jgi:uncharacterized protein (TIGR02147 family)
LARHVFRVIHGPKSFDHRGTRPKRSLMFVQVAAQWKTKYKVHMIPNYYPLDPRVYVREELEIRQKRRPQYSMRAFARDLQISPSFLCEFLAGRQGLSRARALWIAEKIKLSGDQSEHFWDLIQAQFGFPEPVKKAAAVRALDRSRTSGSHLALDRFHLVADWYCFVLLEILGLETAPKSLAEISRLMDVPESDLVDAVQRLKTLGFLAEEAGDSGDVRYKVMTEMTTVGDEVDNRAVQIAHQQTLRAHAEAIERKPFADRENFTSAFALPQADWPAFRRDIQKAILDTVAKYSNSSKGKDQVISLTMQAMTLLEPAREQETPTQ